jgi:hypothetical protein
MVVITPAVVISVVVASAIPINITVVVVASPVSVVVLG